MLAAGDEVGLRPYIPPFVPGSPELASSWLSVLAENAQKR